MNYWASERIQLRGIELEDAETFHSWNSDSEMARNVDFLWPPSSLSNVKNWLETRIKKEFENDEIHCIIESKSGDFIGIINSHDCDKRTGCFQYGLAVQTEQRRKGYASEAICLFIRYFFEELRYQKVTVAVHSFNEASSQLHEQLGFQLEGRLRRMVYTNGRYYDQLLYGMTKEEFKERYG